MTARLRRPAPAPALARLHADGRCAPALADADVDARLHTRIESSERAFGYSEPLGKLDLELSDLLPHVCESGEDVAGQQSECELVRVVKNNGVVDWQVKR